MQNQQNHIAHEALFQRANNSEGCNGIDYDGKKDTYLYMAWNGSVDREHDPVAWKQTGCNKIIFLSIIIFSYQIIYQKNVCTRKRTMK